MRTQQRLSQLMMRHINIPITRKRPNRTIKPSPRSGLTVLRHSYNLTRMIINMHTSRAQRIIKHGQILKLLYPRGHIQLLNRLSGSLLRMLRPILHRFPMLRRINRQLPSHFEHPGQPTVNRRSRSRVRVKGRRSPNNHAQNRNAKIQPTRTTNNIRKGVSTRTMTLN